MRSTHFHNNLLEEILKHSIIYSCFAIQAIKVLLSLEQAIRRGKMTSFVLVLLFFFFLNNCFKSSLKAYH